MTKHNLVLSLERYAREYQNDPEFIAEKLALKIIEELLENMHRANLSQSDLAQKMGVSREHISRILNAPPNMTLLTIAKLAMATGATPEVRLNPVTPHCNVSKPDGARAVAIQN
jgi:plasmid maintenance system antidote protein VapI